MIYIKNVLLNEQRTNILIDGNRISAIGADVKQPAQATVIDGTNRVAFPTFANVHTHATMTLFRGFGDDHDLGDWLNNWIWPNERNLNPEIIYWGAKLAAVEMIKSGTTACADMYFFPTDVARAFEDCGIRAMVSNSYVSFNAEMAAGVRKSIEELEPTIEEWNKSHQLTQITINVHASNTVDDDSLRLASEFCARHNTLYHIHMNETQAEIDTCMERFGCRPYEHLEQLGIMEQCGSRLIGAHSLHLSDNEIAILAKYHANVVHNPNSNLKLASGHQFLYNELRDAGVNVTLGTDGCSSSNNLDMIEAAKVMSLLQKGWRKDPLALPATEVLKVATANGYKALRLDGGEIAVGKLADLMLVDLDNLAFVPNNNSISNLIYAAHGDAVNTVICNGAIVMQDRHVKGEEETIREARRVVNQLITIRP
ncbi:MAG: amidohydrolase [Bacteroidales bacterium]|nr:amidohydrolase [Candidatus Colimorpha onthohippi]